MNNSLRIGMVGLDTSHVTTFTALLNDPAAAHHVAGAKVVAGFPGGSKDFELSWSRVDGFTKTLKDQWSVEIMDSPEAVAEAVDLLFITACDGRVHREYLDCTLRFKRPTFIDKPLAVTSDDARRMVGAARSAGVPMMSCSSLRYADPFVEALSAGRDGLLGCDVYGPVSEVPTQPGLFFYGIHSFDMLVRAMGTGCGEVQSLRTETCDVVALAWPDGRMGSFRGMKNAHYNFGATLHRKEGSQAVDTGSAARPPYAAMLEAILRELPQGRSDVPPEEMIETVRLVEAANESRLSGRAVKV